MTDAKNDYSDIINLPHHVSERHPQMSMQNRAAQFAPFAALTGFEEKIEETGYSVEEYFSDIDEKLSADQDESF